MIACSPVGRTGLSHSPVPRHPIRDGTVPSRAVMPGGVVALVEDPAADVNAAWRAALVARDRGLPVHLVCVRPHADALPAAMAALRDLAAELKVAIQVQVSYLAIVGRRAREGLQAAGDASLLVVPASRGRWSSWFGGARALHLMRRAARPVLWVRRPACRSYRRVLAAIGLVPGAGEVIAAAARLTRDPRFGVLHVLDSTYEEIMRLADVPARVIDANREVAAHNAHRAIEELVARSVPSLPAPQPVIRFGHASLRILQEEVAVSADLIVLGKHPRSALADWVRFGVADRVIGSARADVLLVPL